MSWFRTPPIYPFSDLASKGKGFMVNGKKFVHHSELGHGQSAVVSITGTQKVFFVFLVLALTVLLWFDWRVAVMTLVGLLSAFYFFDLLFGLFLAYRSFSRNPEIHISQRELIALRENELPTYTVFCPLYKEWQVLPQFIAAMEALEYPKQKLQVMLQLEEDDTETVQRARAMSLPPYFQIVVVPNSKPKTKPKAMNYGLGFATGEIITIYDAEDVPDPLQLKKVVVAFSKLPDNTACVQGKLNFYNPGQNMLTRMFTAEYSLWFDLVLPGLQSIHAPIPLGGTSNHFKKRVLEQIAGWDAYNVTEDCDLGLRLVREGFQTAIVDSVTLEEANSGYHNWYRQRSRWIKGYMQTFLVHMRHPSKTAREFGVKNFLLMQLTVGGKVLSMFINPLLWLITLAYFANRTVVAPFIEPFFPPLVLYIGVVSLIFGNFFYLYAYLIGLAKRRDFRLMKFVVFVPFYWLGMSLAAWKAFYELIVKPHYWQKTVHGLHLKPEMSNEKREMSTTLGLDIPSLSADALQSTPATALMTASAELEGLSLQTNTRLNSHRAQTRDLSDAEGVSIPVLAQELVETLQVATGVAEPVAVQPMVSQSAAQTSRKENLIHSARNSIQNQLQVLKTDTTVREGVWLVVGSIAANFFNFLFNAVLGRTLSLDDFGLVTLFNTILSLLAILFGALSATVAHQVAFLEGKKQTFLGTVFSRITLRKTFFIGFIASIIWVLSDTSISRFFQVSDLILIWFFAPAVLFGAMASVQNGVLKGRLAFRAVGIAVAVEAVSKLAFAVAFMWSGRTDLIAMSIPASIAISFLITDWYVGKASREVIAEQELLKADEKYVFPRSFFGASTLSTLASALFLNVDVLVAKHYLSPEDAGAYALLSLVGKMIFLFGSLLTTFINSVVSKHEGASTDPRQTFARIFKLTIFTALLAYIGVGPLGFISVPLLLGEKATSIVQYLNLYGLGIVGFTLSSAIVSYRVARKHFSYAWIQVVVTIGMLAGLVVFHDSLWHLTFVVYVSGVVSLIAVVVWRAIQEHSRFVLRNITDFLDLFAPIPSLSTKLAKSKKRILIFNWRDITHRFAGGAETYIHELGKRWVEAGHEVTLFAGNDGFQPREGIIDGIRVIRRGGFYFVYLWAYVYYIFRFRGQFDLILDCQNGIPFFTPLYAREPVYCLLHHVHQEVFHKYLPKPLALFAAFLESKVMPYVYRDTKFITVSVSSQKEMADLGLGLAGTEVVYPGVDLTSLAPGEQAERPVVLYLGRLKAYKSVDLLIRAFERVLKIVPTAQLIIAGGGEDEQRLLDVRTEVGLSEEVKFLGKVTDAEKVSLLQQAWVFVNPSMMEGWGITTIEANACGVPVVASNVPGLRESVKNPHTGYLVPYGDVEALAERITELLQKHDVRAEMSKNAVVWAKQFDWNLSAKKTLELISNSETKSAS